MYTMPRNYVRRLLAVCIGLGAWFYGMEVISGVEMFALKNSLFVQILLHIFLENGA